MGPAVEPQPVLALQPHSLASHPAPKLHHAGLQHDPMHIDDILSQPVSPHKHVRLLAVFPRQACLDIDSQPRKLEVHPAVAAPLRELDHLRQGLLKIRIDQLCKGELADYSCNMLGIFVLAKTLAPAIGQRVAVLSSAADQGRPNKLLTGQGNVNELLHGCAPLAHQDHHTA